MRPFWAFYAVCGVAAVQLLIGLVARFVMSEGPGWLIEFDVWDPRGQVVDPAVGVWLAVATVGNVLFARHILCRILGHDVG